MATPQTERKPVVLIIRDGWGRNPHREHDSFNAVHLAHTPVADALMQSWPTTLIKTCGEDVGLPPGIMGNSEVGHQNIGAGRVVDQEVMRITRRIRDGSFFENEGFLGAFHHARSSGGKVHLIGLVSNGLVHSDIEHLFALIDLAAMQHFSSDRLFVHALTDGRDTGPTTGLGFLQQVEDTLAEAKSGRIGSVIGRFWAMDRDHRWERIAWAYGCLTGKKVAHPKLTPDMQTRSATDALQGAVQWAYDNPIGPSQTGDEFIPPTQMADGNGNPLGLIEAGDAVIFFNYRGDRPRELTKAFTLDDAAWEDVQGGGFDRGNRIDNLYFCAMTGYETGLPVSAIAFAKPPRMENILGQVVSDAGLTQFRCAETEKFPHVTFFFNDYREEPFPSEHRLLIPSPQEVATYDQKPEMSAEGICTGVLDRLDASDCESLLIVNFANPDMVGHTGKLDAVIKAVETVDGCVGRIVESVLAKGGSCLVMADHGNAEQMWNPEHACPHTAHTTYDIPLILIGQHFQGHTLTEGGRLADIAPTLLAMMGIESPPEMTGKSLISVRQAASLT